MSDLDEAILDAAERGGLILAVALALLLGLRHATDPDHLGAVSSLVMSDNGRGPRRAAVLGGAWGAGHALTLVALGLPVVMFGASLPAVLHTALEISAGALLIALGASLIFRSRRCRPQPRSRSTAFSIGLVHGASGSAGVGVLLAASMPGRVSSLAAVVVLAGGTAIAMAAVSGAVGLLLTRGLITSRIERVAPLFGGLTALAGVWYAAAAL